MMLVNHVSIGGHLERGMNSLQLFPLRKKKIKAYKKNLHLVYLQGLRASLISAHAIFDSIKENEQNLSLIVANLSIP